MPIDPKDTWDAALQFGAVGMMLFLCVCALCWFIISQKKDAKESNTKVITLLETTVKENTTSNISVAQAQTAHATATAALASAIRGLPCNNPGGRFGSGSNVHGE